MNHRSHRIQRSGTPKPKPGTLEWLASEARRWETRHERNRDLLPALSDHWMRRAHATRAALQLRTRASHPAPARRVAAGDAPAAAEPAHASKGLH